MNEVQTMTAVGAKVGRVVGTGLHTARVNAIRAGQAGIDKATQAVAMAEQKLAEQGISPQQLQEALAENTAAAKTEATKITRRTRKKLAKQAKMASKELTKRTAKAQKKTKRVGKDLSAALEPPQRRRRWPWIVGLLVAAGGAAYVVMSRRPQEVRLEEEFDSETPINGYRSAHATDKAKQSEAEH